MATGPVASKATAPLVGSLVLAFIYLALAGEIHDEFREFFQLEELNGAPKNYICPNAPAPDTTFRNLKVVLHTIDGPEVKVATQVTSEWPMDTFKRFQQAGFDPTKPTIIYLHAFIQSYNNPWLKEIRNHYDQMAKDTPDGKANFNLLLFDWSTYSKRLYLDAVSHVPHIGLAFGKLLAELNKQLNYDMNLVHVVSYSLSTHVAGLGCRYVKPKSTVGRLTLLDPTRVCFNNDYGFGQLFGVRPDDANLVEARHYNLGGLGAGGLLGSLDIIVNGGSRQDRNSLARKQADGDMQVGQPMKNKTLITQGKHHWEAPRHDVNINYKSNCKSIAYACADHKTFLTGQCADCGPTGDLCYDLDSLSTINKLAQGLVPSFRTYPLNSVMFIENNNAKCVHHYQVRLIMKPAADETIIEQLEKGAYRVHFGEGSVRPRFRMGDRTFTKLALSEKPIDASSVSIRPADVKDVTHEQFFKMLDQIESIEFNYMSETTPEARRKLSFQLCWGWADESLDVCDQDTKGPVTISE